MPPFISPILLGSDSPFESHWNPVVSFRSNVGIAMPLAPSPSHHHFYGLDGINFKPSIWWVVYDIAIPTWYRIDVWIHTSIEYIDILIYDNHIDSNTWWVIYCCFLTHGRSSFQKSQVASFCNIEEELPTEDAWLVRLRCSSCTFVNPNKNVLRKM